MYLEDNTIVHAHRVAFSIILSGRPPARRLPARPAPPPLLPPLTPRESDCVWQFGNNKDNLFTKRRINSQMADFQFSNFGEWNFLFGLFAYGRLAAAGGCVILQHLCLSLGNDGRQSIHSYP